MVPRLLVAACLLLLAPSAAGALNGVVPYEHRFEFLALHGDGAGGRLELFSSAVDGSLADQQGTYAFRGLEGLRITGLDRVCWDPSAGLPTCAEGGGPYEIVVLDGGGAAIDLQQKHTGRFQAAHALVVLADLGGMAQEVDLPGQGIVAAAIDGRMDMGALSAIPYTGAVPDAQRAGGLHTIGASTRVEVRDASGVLHAVRGAKEAFLFEGAPAIAPFAATSAVLPFEPGATLALAPSSPAHADAGVRIALLQQTLAAFQDDAAPEDGPELDPLMRPLLNGAVLGFPVPRDQAEGIDLANLTLVRFQGMQLDAFAGGAAATAVSPLAVQGGQVEGAQPLVGLGWFAFPWWSYLLWGTGILLVVLRVATRAPRKVERFDRRRWIGHLSGIAALLLVFFLWDLEFRHVLGVSLLQASGASMSLGVLAALQVGLFSLMMFATAAPLNLVLENMSRLARFGSLMGMTRPVATLLGFAMGAKLLLAYMGFVLARVAGG